MIYLPDVTLIALSSIQIPETIEALKISSEKIRFGSVKLVSHEIPKKMPEFIDFEFCQEIKNIMDYNRYMFMDFGKHVLTKHCLLIQYHGYVINPELWNDEWLEYDYGGAPWAIRPGSYMANDGTRSRVGNGGFSLRSKRLLDFPRENKLYLRQEQGYYNEDGNICCYWRREFNENGMKFMPVEKAAIFSFETLCSENLGIQTFGFHKFINPTA